MAAAGIVDCSPYGMASTECNELVIAPEWSEYVGKHSFLVLRESWSRDRDAGQSAY
jgi:hypothetical protein